MKFKTVFLFAVLLVSNSAFATTYKCNAEKFNGLGDSLETDSFQIDLKIAKGSTLFPCVSLFKMYDASVCWSEAQGRLSLAVGDRGNSIYNPLIILGAANLEADPNLLPSFVLRAMGDFKNNRAESRVDVTCSK